MSSNIRIKDITIPNNFDVYIKKGESAFPLTDYTFYKNFQIGSFSGFIDITDYVFDNNENYWIKIIDTVTNRYVIKNIKIDYCST